MTNTKKILLYAGVAVVGYQLWKYYSKPKSVLVKGSDADPDMKSYHLGELQCMQMAIEEEIEALEHDLAMLPLKLMLGGFIIFVIGMTIYMMS